jgi:DNA-binding GntR family transcriptional regulator
MAVEARPSIESRHLLVSSSRPNDDLPDYLAGRYNSVAAVRGRDAVIELVINMVASGSLNVGEMRSEKDVAAAMGMSRTPLREALAVLSRDGLIRQVPQRGFFVVRINDRDVSETIEMRRGIEPRIVRQLAEVGADHFGLGDLMRWMERASNAVEFGARDTTFHVTLAEAAGYPNGARTLVAWRNQVRVFRAERPLTDAERHEVTAEHWTIVQAIESRNVDGAAMAMDRHLLNTRARLLGDRQPEDLAPVNVGTAVA